MIVHCELSTPVTTESLTNHSRGALYGYPATPKRFRQRYLSPRTPVRGLFLTGSDAMTLGIMGATMGGVLAAGLSLGPMGFTRVIGYAMRNAHKRPGKEPAQRAGEPVATA